MKLSDYNRLRSMLGYEKISLGEQEYFLHVKERLLPWLEEVPTQLKAVGRDLTFAGTASEPFCQNGHLGADYLVIVPDSVAEAMRPYYTQLAVMAKEIDGKKLQETLPSDQAQGGIEAVGTDLISYSGNTFLKDTAVSEMKSVLILLCFPLMYMGMILLCVSLTVLSIQQLSSLSVYRVQYGILQKLGMSSRERERVLWKQQALFYLCPAVAASLSSLALLYALGKKFLLYTGLKTAPLQYAGLSLGFFMGIYLLYFFITGICMQRGICREKP